MTPRSGPGRFRCLFLLLGLAAASLMGGCATVDGGDREFNMIVKDRTPFTSGPNQIVPDSYLEAGSRVRIVSGAGDFVRVQTVSGDTGLVPADSLARNPDVHGE